MSVARPRAELVAAAHENLMEVNALLTAATPGGALERGDGDLLYASPHPFRFLSGARRLARPPAPDGVEVRQVEDLATAREYWELCEISYRSLDFPAGVFATFPPELLMHPAVSAWVAYLRGAPASAAMVVSTAGVGMVAWVATLDAARGRGLGGLCTVLATNESFERGDSFASLQASAMGEAIYRRLGYEHLCTYKGFASD